MNELQAAMANADNSLKEVEKRLQKSPGDVFEDALTSVSNQLAEMLEANEQRADDAHNTLRQCDTERATIDRYRRAIHAAQTELTRP